MLNNNDRKALLHNFTKKNSRKQNIFHQTSDSFPVTPKNKLRCAKISLYFNLTGLKRKLSKQELLVISLSSSAG